MARHIAANAAAPDSNLPSSRAWKRASRSARSIGQASDPGLGRVHELDAAGAVEAPHQRDLLLAERTAAIVPDGQLAHRTSDLCGDMLLQRRRATMDAAAVLNPRSPAVSVTLLGQPLRSGPPTRSSVGRRAYVTHPAAGVAYRLETSFRMPSVDETRGFIHRSHIAPMLLASQVVQAVRQPIEGRR
jgi:hypothetical protein